MTPKVTGLSLGSVLNKHCETLQVKQQVQTVSYGLILNVCYVYKQQYKVIKGYLYMNIIS